MAVHPAAATLDQLFYVAKSYRDPVRVKRDILDTISRYPALYPRTGSLANRGPASANVIIYLTGTVPVAYHGAQYNIPICVWIVENYPFTSPVAYVAPTKDMVVKPRHKHVDSAGLCYLPYITNWNSNTCSLSGLINALVAVFTEDPPVRAIPKAAPPPASTMQLPQYGAPATTASPAPAATPSPVPGYPYPANPSPAYPPPGYTAASSVPPPVTRSNSLPPNYNISLTSSSAIPPVPPRPHSSGNPFEDPAVVIHKNSISLLTQQLQERLRNYNQMTTSELDRLFAENKELTLRIATMESDKQKVQLDRENLQMQMRMLNLQHDEIDRWFTENEHKLSNLRSASEVDKATDPADPIRKQLLSLVAEDEALNDVIYYLDKALANRKIDRETYLKQMRKLCCDQFIARATINKILSATPPSASSAPAPARVPMPAVGSPPVVATTPSGLPAAVLGLPTKKPPPYMAPSKPLPPVPTPAYARP